MHQYQGIIYHTNALKPIISASLKTGRRKEKRLKAEEILMQIRETQGLIDTLNTEIERAEGRGMSISANMGDGMPRGKGGKSERVANAAIEACDYYDKVKAYRKALVDLKLDIWNLILTLKPAWQDILIKYYFHRYTWEQVAEARGCSYRAVNKMNKNALKRLDEMLGE